MSSTIGELEEQIRRCKKCRRCYSREQAVPGEGNPEADILLFGEAPGKKENQTGRPFVGRAGTYLNKLLQSFDLKRKDLYITSILKCFHTGPPTKEEMNICKPWSIEQIKTVRPKKILVMGKSAQWGLLQQEQKLSDIRHQSWNGIPCIVTCHPAAGMRFPQRHEQFRKGLEILLSK
jgi:DNA polymerase